MQMGSVLGLLYLIVAVVCVGVSTYATYEGFQSMLRWAAAPVAVAIGAGLLASDIAILRGRQNNRSIRGPALALLIFTAMSATANFNFFYTQLMRDQVVSERLARAYTTFEANMRNGRAAVGALGDFAAREQQIEQQLRNLKSQARDRLNPGIGPEAEAHIREIERLLAPATITNLKRPPRTDGQATDDFLERFERDVRAALLDARSRDPVPSTVAAIDGVAADFLNRKSSIEDRTGPDAWRIKRDEIDAMAEATLSMQSRISQVSTIVERPVGVQMTPTLSTHIELDDISRSLQNGFTENFGLETIVALFVALLIDLMPLLVGVLIIQPSRGALSESGGDKGNRKIAGVGRMKQM